MLSGEQQREHGHPRLLSLPTPHLAKEMESTPERLLFHQKQAFLHVAQMFSMIKRRVTSCLYEEA